MDKNNWLYYFKFMFIILFLILAGLHIYHLGYIDGIQLGYIGAILGGGMTLIGVRWSIDIQNKQQKRELSNQYKPILLINNKDFSYSENCDEMHLKFKLANVGRGEALDINVSIIDIRGVEMIYKNHFDILVNNSEINYKLSILREYNYQPDNISDDELIDYSFMRSIKNDDESEYLLNFPSRKMKIIFKIDYFDIYQNHYNSYIKANLFRNISLRKLKADSEYIGTWKCSFDELKIKLIEQTD